MRMKSDGFYVIAVKEEYPKVRLRACNSDCSPNRIVNDFIRANAFRAFREVFGNKLINCFAKINHFARLSEMVGYEIKDYLQLH